ncbi:hypothetical protein C8J56DRAFT_1066218 [Mycena floridula]|nr:hypothetical protein C8J56DRAFT_1066218 [Mycena floridula]
MLTWHTLCWFCLAWHPFLTLQGEAALQFNEQLLQPDVLRRLVDALAELHRHLDLDTEKETEMKLLGWVLLEPDSKRLTFSREMEWIQCMFAQLSIDRQAQFPGQQS